MFQLDGLLGNSGQIVLSLVEKVEYSEIGNARMLTKLKTNMVMIFLLAVGRRLKKNPEIVTLDLVEVVPLVNLCLLLPLLQEKSNFFFLQPKIHTRENLFLNFHLKNILIHTRKNLFLNFH